MRFIVDLFRGLILLFLAIDLIGASWLGFMLAFGPLANGPLSVVYAAAAIGAAITIIIGLGLTAAFISIHDRIAEMAEQSRRIADLLQSFATQPAMGDRA